MLTKLVAVPRKCTLQVIQFASSERPRFGIIKNYGGGTAIIPDGFMAESISDGLTWLVMTKVDETGIVWFKCTCKTDETMTSTWVKTMSLAYKQANGNGSRNPRYTKGSNGRIVFGLTYPDAQDEIRRKFGDVTVADAHIPPQPQVQHTLPTFSNGSRRLSKKREDSAGPVAEPPKLNRSKRQTTDMVEDQMVDGILPQVPPPPLRRRGSVTAAAVPQASATKLPSSPPIRHEETSSGDVYSVDYPDICDGIPLPEWMAKHVGI